LKSLNIDYNVIGRSVKSCDKFYNLTKIKPTPGGVNNYLKTQKEIPSHAIISVGILDLKDVALSLINFEIKNILIEKPGGLNMNELRHIQKISKQKGSRVYIAYNRRFYASTKKTIEIIDKDDGLLSFNFEFTEWTNLIKTSELQNKILQNYFFANSSHVVDLAFFIGGAPKTMNSFVSNSLPWHTAGAIFSGSGISSSNSLFTYHANWKSPGRWGVEFLTKNHRLILRPMEKLQILKLNSIEAEFDDEIDYSLDENYKPGLFNQVDCFIYNQDNLELNKLCTIDDQINNYKNFYRKIANYR
ncbi:MAG: myo-inositol 2-dehydrogenase, partial [Candidatus Marinimicrobia bacterium]|nr:myo-inositol 2-dehydrogenase [Candidatus Neomarinimicrobiota bacterium]